MAVGEDPSGPRALGALDRIVARLRAESGWVAGSEGFVLRRSWTKQGSGRRFHLVELRPEGELVVLKLGDPRPADGFDRVVLAAVELHELFEASGLGVAAPKVLGWLRTPPVLALAYVPGTDLVDFLKDPRDPIWRTPEIVGDVYAALGVALATFHRSRRLEPGDLAAVLAAVARRRRRLGLRRDRRFEAALRADPRLVVRRYGDFGPGNVRLGPDGGIWMLDPPARPSFDVPHADLANLIFETRKRLCGSSGPWRRPEADRLLASFVASLGAGYGSASGLELDLGTDPQVAVEEARRARAHALKRVKAARWGEARWFASTGIRLRRKAAVLTPPGSAS